MTDPGPLDAYLSGEKLYGDDFTPEEIRAWHEDERDAYAALGARDARRYRYTYHALNTRHGFDRLPDRRFAHVLGFGSAYGDEFQPLADRIDRLTIADPSRAFVRARVHGIPATYVEPAADGTLPFADGAFDLVTCLGVLHHIPNVSHALAELHRCLAPGGYALVREPVVSMGDWRRPRRGLTRRERGIPLPLLRRMIRATGFEVASEQLCFFPLIPRLWRVLGRPAYESPLATRLDALLSRAFAWNLHYHATSIRQKLRPTNAYYVLFRESRR